MSAVDPSTMGSPPRSWPLRFVAALALAAVFAAASVSCVDAVGHFAPAMNAREVVAMLVARLPAGSSPRGAGH